MSTAIIVIASITLIIFLNAIFVAGEFSSIRARKTRLQQLADEGNKLAVILAPIKADSAAMDNYIAACQLGITATSLILGAYGQNTVALLIAPSLAALGNWSVPVAQSISTTIVLAFLTIVQVVVAELLPKSLTLQYPEQIALSTVVPVRWSQIVLKPFIWLFNGSGTLILRLFGFTHSSEESHFHSPGEIELLVSDSHEGGLIDDKEQQMLRNAFRMRELTARQIMVPRTRLIAASRARSVQYVLNKAIDAGYTRIPIYKKTIDNIIGFVHVKDLFKQYLNHKEDVIGAIRDIIYVPETMPVLDVWKTLNKHRQYMTVVFDEYGGTAGLITFEDLIEEIFGEVEDEFDQDLIAPYHYDHISGRAYLRGDLLISDVNEYLGLTLPTDENDTLGGLVFSVLGHLPQNGDEVEIGPQKIRVETIIPDNGLLELSLEIPDDETPPEIGEWEVSPRE